MKIKIFITIVTTIVAIITTIVAIITTINVTYPPTHLPTYPPTAQGGACRDARDDAGGAQRDVEMERGMVGEMVDRTGGRLQGC